jgi:hypothetical protein
MHTVRLVAAHGQLHPGQPAAHHAQHWPGALWSRLMAPPQSTTDLWGGRGNTPHGQRPWPRRPGWGEDQGQHDPPPPAGGHRAWLARGPRLAVVPPRAQAATPAPLHRLVDDEGEGAAHGDKGPHQEQEYAAIQRQRGPTRAVEPVSVEAAVGRLTQAHLAQGGRHRPPSPGQEGSDAEHLYCAPGRWRQG